MQADCNLQFISYQGLFLWDIKLLDCEVMTHLHLAPWVRLEFYPLHHTLMAWCFTFYHFSSVWVNSFTCLQIHPPLHLELLQHCHSSVKVMTFFTWIYEKNVSLIHLKICMVGGWRSEWVREWVGVTLKLCRKWNAFLVGIFVNIVACEQGSPILLLSQCLIL